MLSVEDWHPASEVCEWRKGIRAVRMQSSDTDRGGTKYVLDVPYPGESYGQAEVITCNEGVLVAPAHGTTGLEEGVGDSVHWKRHWRKRRHWRRIFVWLSNATSRTRAT